MVAHLAKVEASDGSDPQPERLIDHAAGLAGNARTGYRDRRLTQTQ